MKKDTHPLLQLLAMLGMMLGLMLLCSIISSAISLLTGISPTSRGFLLPAQAIIQLLTFGLPVWLMLLIYHRDEQTAFLQWDFSKPKWILGLSGIVIMLLLSPLNDRLTEWNDAWDLGSIGDMLRSAQDATEGLMETMIGTTSVGGLLANLLVIALVPAVTEELFFRCGVQNLLQRWTRNPHLSIWISAIIFSLAHGEVFAFMPRLVMGATLGYLYVYGRSVLPNMLAHFVNNAIVVILYWLSARGTIDIDLESPTHFPWLLIGCCTLAAVLLFCATFTKRLKK